MTRAVWASGPPIGDLPAFYVVVIPVFYTRYLYSRYTCILDHGQPS